MSENDAPFELSNVKIPSKTPGWNLDAWKYVPKNKTSGPLFPVIVMAHGFSANKKMGLAPYAEEFVSKGYACVVFDYRRFGDSDGSPRDCVYTSEQLEDYRTVIAWVRQHQDEFDSQRVILWGTSYSGGHAVSLASEQNLKLACAIAQCPYVGKAAKPPFGVFLKMSAYGVVDLLRQMVRCEPLYISACAEPGKMGAMTTPDSIAGLERLVRDKRDYPNRISASSMFEFPFYNPSSKASKISCPLLLVIAERDELCPLDFVLRRVVSASKYVSESRTHGGHFDMYHGGSDYETSLKAQLEFIQRHVPTT
ncbi:hypothetical protein ACEPAI_7070 [Sanghuangporus weigelae]